MADIGPHLQQIVDRFADPAVQAALKGFTTTLQFTFTDTHESWLLRTVDGKEATLSREAVEQSDIAELVGTADLAGIMNKSAHPVTTYL